MVDTLSSGSAVLSMVQADMHGAAQFGKIAIEISKKKFDVTAENLSYFSEKYPCGRWASRCLELNIRTDR